MVFTIIQRAYNSTGGSGGWLLEWHTLALFTDGNSGRLWGDLEVVGVERDGKDGRIGGGGSGKAFPDECL